MHRNAHKRQWHRHTATPDRNVWCDQVKFVQHCMSVHVSKWGLTCTWWGNRSLCWLTCGHWWWKCLHKVFFLWRPCATCHYVRHSKGSLKTFTKKQFFKKLLFLMYIALNGTWKVNPCVFIVFIAALITMHFGHVGVKCNIYVGSPTVAAFCPMFVQLLGNDMNTN